MSESPTETAPPGGVDYIAVEGSPPFQELKRKHRSFVFPLSVAFLVWYFAYVLLSSFAPEFMAQRVWGDITLGLLFGLGQFVTTFANHDVRTSGTPTASSTRSRQTSATTSSSRRRAHERRLRRSPRGRRDGREQPRS